MIVTLLLLGSPMASPAPTTTDSNAVRALGQAIKQYQDIDLAGGWPTIPAKLRLEPGATGPAVLTLRARLIAERYPVEGHDPERYDAALASAVRRFQELHGLQPDGVVGPGTIKALNVTATRRAAQLAANLDRALRDPPLEFERFIEVNIPAFTLEVIEAGKSVLTLRTIVGRVDWPTPTLSSIVTDVMFGPSWAVPRSIAIREILPLVRKNPRYFTETRTRVFAGGIEVDPGSVDWSRMTSRTFAYRLVQEPGPLNPLGGAKLLFRSPFQVYAHDTPGRSLFARERRALSHGCIRVEHIEQLLAYLLPTWSSDSIHRLMREGRDTRVPLHDAVAIQVVYRTAWVERDGMVAFRDDIYDLDRPENQPGFMEFSPSLTGFRAIMRGTKQR